MIDRAGSLINIEKSGFSSVAITIMIPAKDPHLESVKHKRTDRVHDI